MEKTDKRENCQCGSCQCKDCRLDCAGCADCRKAGDGRLSPVDGCDYQKKR